MNSLAYTWAVGLVGLKGQLVRVEAQLSPGLPSFVLIGLPDAALREARERVRAAVSPVNGVHMSGRVTVNLLPAAVPKTGTSFDLAIAMSLCTAHRVVSADVANQWVFIGELGLDGQVHPVRGILPAVAGAVAAGRNHIVVPAQCQSEASLVPGANIQGVSHVNQAINLLGGQAPLPDIPSLPTAPNKYRPPLAPLDLQEVLGQTSAKFALEVAAAGGHHLFMMGAPGAGKTMLAARMPGILPPLTDEESVEVTTIHSVAGEFDPVGGLIRTPPFQAPHHSATLPAMVGGGTGTPRPGAVSLAHLGILFLDEAPEFAARVLDSLRQPLESGELTIHRAAAQATFPARFQLVMAANPCPCGKGGTARGRCECTHRQRHRYLSRLSGPLLDRIDLQLEIAPPTRGALLNAAPAETSEQVARRVAAARARAVARWQAYPWNKNADIPGPFLRKFNPGGPGSTKQMQAKLNQAVDRGILTMRGADRVLKVAWTIADLRQLSHPGLEEIQAAMALRVRS